MPALLTVPARMALGLAMIFMCLLIPSAMAAPITRAAQLPNLRILPLGDSITKGSQSSHNNGYRDYLRRRLGAEGAKVDMIGTLRNGVMQDNNHEGHSGNFIAEIATYWQKPTAAKPNVVLLHAGTNNMDLEVDLDRANELYNTILDGIYKASPYTTIFVAPVIWANDPRMQKNTDAFNEKLRAAVKKRQDAGRKVVLTPVDISSPADLADKKHPNDAGYQKMADAWFRGIMDANARGLLEPPAKINQADYPGVGLGWNR